MTIGKFDYYLLYSNGYSRRVLEIGYDVVSVGMLVRFRETIGLFSAAEIGKSAADLLADYHHDLAGLAPNTRRAHIDGMAKSKAKSGRVWDIPDEPAVMGRPSDYTPEIGFAFCKALAEGKSAAKVCADPKMPSLSQVFEWFNRFPDFGEAYARAVIERAERIFEDALEIADDETIDPQSRRVRVDTRKWFLAKMHPKKFSEKVISEVTGANGAPLQIEAKVQRIDSAALDSEAREALRLALLAAQARIEDQSE